MPLFDEVFLEKLRETRKVHADYITASSAKDFSDYKRVCGFIEGIDVAVSEFKELLRTVDGDSQEL